MTASIGFIIPLDRFSPSTGNSGLTCLVVRLVGETGGTCDILYGWHDDAYYLVRSLEQTTWCECLQGCIRGHSGALDALASGVSRSRRDTSTLSVLIMLLSWDIYHEYVVLAMTCASEFGPTGIPSHGMDLQPLYGVVDCWVRREETRNGWK